jgi:hypothetical protein
LSPRVDNGDSKDQLGATWKVVKELIKRALLIIWPDRVKAERPEDGPFNVW